MEEETIENILSYTCEISLIRMIDNLLIPTNFEVDFVIASLVEDTSDKALNDVFDKFDYWAENYVNNCVAIASDNKPIFSMIVKDGIVQIGNKLMITPESPSDGHLLALLNSKLNAFADGVFETEMAKITPKNELNSRLSNTMFGPIGDLLPKMEEWINGPNWFEKPWWNRDDISTIDSQAPDGTDLKKIPDWARAIEFSDGTGPDIIFNDFKPTVIGE